MYSLQHDDNAHIAVQLQPNDRFSNCVFLFWWYKLYCSGLLEEVHKSNDCSYRIAQKWCYSGTVCCAVQRDVAILPVLQWHCLLNNVVCSTGIDYCSAFHHKLLDTQRIVTSNTVMMEKPNNGHSSVLCLHTAPHNYVKISTLKADLQSIAKKYRKQCD
jgi:hypothetical protein